MAEATHDLCLHDQPEIVAELTKTAFQATRKFDPLDRQSSDLGHFTP